MFILCKCKSDLMEPSPGASNDYSPTWWGVAHNRKYLQSSGEYWVSLPLTD